MLLECATLLHNVYTREMEINKVQHSIFLSYFLVLYEKNDNRMITRSSLLPELKAHSPYVYS